MNVDDFFDFGSGRPSCWLRVDRAVPRRVGRGVTATPAPPRGRASRAERRCWPGGSTTCRSTSPCRPRRCTAGWPAGSTGCRGDAGTKLNVLGPARRREVDPGHAGLSAARGAGEGASPTSGSSPTRGTRPAPIWRTSRPNWSTTRGWRPTIPTRSGEGSVWRSGAIVLRNGVAIEAFGTGQRIRGRRHRAHRPTLIVCDDLQNDSHIRLGRARDRSRTWFHGTLLRAGTPTTNVVNLATALHRDALAMRALHRRRAGPRASSRRSSAGPTNMSLWEAVGSDLRRRRQPATTGRPPGRSTTNTAREMDAGAVVLWPEQEDLYTLMSHAGRERPGGVRAREAELADQSRPVRMARVVLRRDHLVRRVARRRCGSRRWRSTRARGPTRGAATTRRWWRWASDRQGVLYVEADLARRPVAQIVADGVAFYRRFRPDAFGVEANQFQELLGGQFEAEFAAAGRAGRPAVAARQPREQARADPAAGPVPGRRAAAFQERLALDAAAWSSSSRTFPSATTTTAPTPPKWPSGWPSSCSTRRGDDGLGDRLPVEVAVRL